MMSILFRQPQNSRQKLQSATKQQKKTGFFCWFLYYHYAAKLFDVRPCVNWCPPNPSRIKMCEAPSSLKPKEEGVGRAREGRGKTMEHAPYLFETLDTLSFSAIKTTAERFRFADLPPGRSSIGRSQRRQSLI